MRENRRRSLAGPATGAESLPLRTFKCNQGIVPLDPTAGAKYIRWAFVKGNQHIMNTNELIETWKREEQQPFLGWDFSYLDGRMIEEQAPWSYSSRAADLMRQALSVVDLGTGGGERLLKLQKYWPKKVVVTEEYPPNFRLATERLSSFGVQVVDVRLTDVDLMPFSNGEFDLVLNRHSGFNAKEVARILATGGTFLTQQVHGLWAYDLLAVFDAKPQWPDATLGKYVLN